MSSLLHSFRVYFLDVKQTLSFLEDNKMDVAAAADPNVETDAAIAAALAATIDEAGPIDENLFDDEDLDGLDEDLEQLNI